MGGALSSSANPDQAGLNAEQLASAFGHLRNQVSELSRQVLEYRFKIEDQERLGETALRVIEELEGALALAQGDLKHAWAEAEAAKERAAAALALLGKVWNTVRAEPAIETTALSSGNAGNGKAMAEPSSTPDPLRLASRNGSAAGELEKGQGEQHAPLQKTLARRRPQIRSGPRRAKKANHFAE